jgi:putative transposase
MPRGPRIVTECGIFHITARGNNKKRLFYKDSEFKYFKELLLKYKKKFRFRLHHYALMKNHVHICLSATKRTDISRMMQALLVAYCHYHKRRYRYSGHLFQGRFDSKIIESEKYLFNVGMYIELNPVKAGIVESPGEYPWTSYRYYGLGERDDLVDANVMFKDLSESSLRRREIYRELVEERLDGWRSELREGTRSVGKNGIMMCRNGWTFGYGRI